MLCSGFVTPDLLNGHHYCKVIALSQCLNEECSHPREWSSAKARQDPKVGMVHPRSVQIVRRTPSLSTASPFRTKVDHHVFINECLIDKICVQHARCLHSKIAARKTLHQVQVRIPTLPQSLMQTRVKNARDSHPV